MADTLSLEDSDAHIGQFEYNAGSSRPYRCVFCDRCYKYRICLEKHFRELHLNLFIMCGQQALANQARGSQQSCGNQANEKNKAVRVSVIVKNKLNH